VLPFDPNGTLMKMWTKAEARAVALRRRAGADPSAGLALVDHLLAPGVLPGQGAIAGFWPMPGEIDLRPLLHALHAGGRTVLLPQTPPLGQSLIFRRWTPESRMIRERFGTFRPDGEIGTPDILLLPLLAFDRHGNRLGYGGGYYDRTLAALPLALAIGCAFAVQELDAVPVEEYDARLDAIATELGVRRFERP